MRLLALMGPTAKRRLANSVSFCLGEIEIDRERRVVTVAGTPVALTWKEFRLLVEFCNHLDEALQRSQLLHRVWGARYSGGPGTLELHVSRLRAKVGPALRLETLRGFGYRLRSPREREDGPE